MRIRARALGLLALVAVAAAFGFQTGQAQSSTPAMVSAQIGATGVKGPPPYPAARAHHLRLSIAWQRTRSTKLRSLIDLPPLRTNHAERHWRSIAALSWLNRKWHARAQRAFRASRVAVGPVTTVICNVFGYAQCGFAKTIAYRESRYLTTAWNSSDHGGLFQLGTGERATYAMKRWVGRRMTILYRTVYEQVVAAHNLWLDRGWQPWTCCEG